MNPQPKLGRRYAVYAAIVGACVGFWAIVCVGGGWLLGWWG